MDLKRTLARGGILLTLAGACVALPAAPAAAQNQPSVIRTPPKPTKSENPPIYWVFLVVIIVVGGAIGANLIPSKRGHQD